MRSLFTRTKTDAKTGTLTRKQLEDFLASDTEAAEAEEPEMTVKARGTGIFDDENVAWYNTWACIDDWATAGDDGELSFSQQILLDAYVEKYVAQAKVEMWDARHKLKREEDEAIPVPIQFRNLGGSDAPLLSNKL